MSPARATAARRPGSPDGAPLPRADEAVLRLVRGPRRHRVPRALGPTAVSLLLHGIAVAALLAFTLAPSEKDGIGVRLSATLTADLPEIFEEEVPEEEIYEVEDLEPLEMPELPVVYVEEPPLPSPDEMLERLPELETRSSRFDLPVTVASQRTRPEPKPVAPPRFVPPPPRPVRVASRPAPRRPVVATGGRLRPLHMPVHYPDTARRRGIQGVTRVEMIIRADGTILRVRLVGSSGNPTLDQAALASARQWRFAPPGSLRRVIQPLRFSLT